MTANNCDRCGNDKGPDCWDDKCKPAEHRPTYVELEREVERLRAKSNSYSTMLEEAFPAWKFHKQSLVDYAKETIATLRGDSTKAILEMAKARGLAAEERDHRERLQLILTDDYERTGQFARLFDAMTKAIHDREKSDRELTKLRESEAKAWGLLSHVVFATGFGNPQEEDAAMESARTALEARKAGA